MHSLYGKDGEGRKIKRNKLGKGVDIARLDFHDFVGRLQDRTRTATTQKPMGVMMLDKIISRFNLTEEEIVNIRKELADKEKKEFEEYEAWRKSRPFQPGYSPFKGQMRKPFSKV